MRIYIIYENLGNMYIVIGTENILFVKLISYIFSLILLAVCNFLLRRVFIFPALSLPINLPYYSPNRLFHFVFIFFAPYFIITIYSAIY